MSDLISRQAIMERIENEYRQWGEEYDVQQVLGDIEDMPSVTPCKDAISRTKAIEEIRIYRMKDSNDPDIKAFNDGIDTAISVIGHNIPPVTPQPCENAISREKVMMELDKYLAGVEYEKGIDRIIAELPSVTPQRPKGHWIEERNDYGEIQGWHCDKCYEDSGFTTKCKWDFCPNCGADMRGDNT